RLKHRVMRAKVRRCCALQMRFLSSSAVAPTSTLRWDSYLSRSSFLQGPGSGCSWWVVRSDGLPMSSNSIRLPPSSARVRVTWEFFQSDKWRPACPSVRLGSRRMRRTSSIRRLRGAEAVDTTDRGGHGRDDECQCAVGLDDRAWQIWRPCDEL